MKASGAVALEDKYMALEGRVIMSGPQALVRLPMIQQAHDQARGLTTGGYISGYQGSPLATYDVQLEQARPYLERHGIRFQPAVNEELAATACWGTQQLDNFGPAKVDGVFALWYGKGPGVDRAGDAIKHANHSGTHRHGGVLAVFGDDHAGKSSTLAHQSEPAFAANAVPVVYPGTLEEFFEFGLWGWGLSRYSGLWVALKAVNETLEQTASVDLDLARSRLATPPGGRFPPEGVHYRSAYTPALNDTLVVRYKLPLVPHYARANRIDRIARDAGQQRRLGIVAAGKSFQDVLQALKLLGMAGEDAAKWRLSLYKPGLIWPLEPEGLFEFAKGHEELLVIEEKKPFLEAQIKQLLYHHPIRPRIVGKSDEQGAEILPLDRAFDASDIAITLVRRLAKMGVATPELHERVARIQHRREALATRAPAHLVRGAFYCSGCPHNTSTRLPDGSQAMGGIGCHGMATFTRTDTLGVTQMGGEGATWCGVAAFSKLPHVFQNLGDGTYYHSGLLAIRSAVASGVNITYKILLNDATAMTGGQPLAAPVTAGDIVRQVQAERVTRVAVVTDRPELHTQGQDIPAGTDVIHREQLDTLQREFRVLPGVTVIVYEQTCAAEKRRRRKRGTFPDPATRVFIHEDVCEGCGDCSVQSNCVSVVPLETRLGRKRAIDQSSCNKDYSCVKGFCPSFVSLDGARLRKPDWRELGAGLIENLPPPQLQADRESTAVVIAGIGGTGVITVGAVLAMASHLEGKVACTYDMTGMAQKGAAVYSHVKFANTKSGIPAARVGLAEAQLLLGCDLVASTTPEVLETLGPGSTLVVADSTVVPTAAFQTHPDQVFDAAPLQEELRQAVGSSQVRFLDARRLAIALLGDAMATNFLLAGYAYQQGVLPLRLESLLRAIELNGAAVPMNQFALQLGRLLAHAPERLFEAARQAKLSVVPAVSAAPESLEELCCHRGELLEQYQNAAYAARFRHLVERVRVAEAGATPGREDLSRAVAHNFAKLMAYKDEYEVARLYSSPAFKRRLDEQFEGYAQMRLWLAPPLLARPGPAGTPPRKRLFGPWIFPVLRGLARLRGLRGTAFDPFGHTEERREERAWIDRYEALIGELCERLAGTNHALAVEIARVPETIRGYGHVKRRNMEAARKQLASLRARFDTPPPALKAVRSTTPQSATVME